MVKSVFSDTVLKLLEKKYPPPVYTDNSELLYERLIESIISQQLSVKAADTIFARFLKLFTNTRHSGEERNATTLESFPSPQQILKTKDEVIRTAGISFQKISYIKSVATAFATNQINIEKIKHMTDEEVITELTKIRGVGKWTAEMILISTLGRPDVFSIGDLGLRRAIEKLYGLTEIKEILALSEQWKPNRSRACWYLWRSLENV